MTYGRARLRVRTFSRTDSIRPPWAPFSVRAHPSSHAPTTHSHFCAQARSVRILTQLTLHRMASRGRFLERGPVRFPAACTWTVNGASCNANGSARGTSLPSEIQSQRYWSRCIIRSVIFMWSACRQIVRIQMFFSIEHLDASASRNQIVRRGDSLIGVGGALCIL